MSPQQYSEDLYWDYSQFENLTTDEVKKCCYIALDKLIKASDGVMKIYYEESMKWIEHRGVLFDQGMKLRATIIGDSMGGQA